MDEINRLFGSVGRIRADSDASDATHSTGSRLVLRHRLNQLMTCVDDLDPRNVLHEKVVKTLDNAFLACGRRANKPKKDSFRWRTSVSTFPCLSSQLTVETVCVLSLSRINVTLSFFVLTPLFNMNLSAVASLPCTTKDSLDSQYFKPSGRPWFVESLSHVSLCFNEQRKCCVMDVVRPGAGMTCVTVCEQS